MSDETLTGHPAVVHPRRLQARADLRRYESRAWGGISRFNDVLATHLGIIFGSVWIIWIFFIWPLVVQVMPIAVQNKTFYYASGWIQLFALPLFVYIGNKLQTSADAQSDSMVRALTHIATVGDEMRALVGVMKDVLAVVADRLDPDTQGGLQVVVDRLNDVESKLPPVLKE